MAFSSQLILDRNWEVGQLLLLSTSWTLGPSAAPRDRRPTPPHPSPWGPAGCRRSLTCRLLRIARRDVMTSWRRDSLMRTWGDGQPGRTGSGAPEQHGVRCRLSPRLPQARVWSLLLSLPDCWLGAGYWCTIMLIPKVGWGWNGTMGSQSVNCDYYVPKLEGHRCWGPSTVR